VFYDSMIHFMPVAVSTLKKGI